MKRITVDDEVKDLLAEAMKAEELAERLRAKVAGEEPHEFAESDVLVIALRDSITASHERIAGLAEELSR